MAASRRASGRRQATADQATAVNSVGGSKDAGTPPISTRLQTSYHLLQRLSYDCRCRSCSEGVRWSSRSHEE